MGYVRPLKNGTPQGIINSTRTPYENVPVFEYLDDVPFV
jgi:hypothetical protein